MAWLQLCLSLVFAAFFDTTVDFFVEGHRFNSASQALGPESQASVVVTNRPRKVVEEDKQFISNHDAESEGTNDGVVVTAVHSLVDFNNTHEAEGLSLSGTDRAELDPTKQENAAGSHEVSTSTAHDPERRRQTEVGSPDTREKEVDEKQTDTIANVDEPPSAVQKRARKETTSSEDFARNIERLGSDRSWIRDSSGESVSSEPFERQALQILSDDDVYTQAVDTIPGIGFLGSGYDMVMGNPLGDEHTPGDPGFRAPVILFDWGHDKEGVSPDLTTLQPKGSYVRPFVSCQRAQTVEEVESLSAYVADLQADASSEGKLSFVPFSGSFHFRQMADESNRKQTKTFILRAYCLRYEAGFAAVGMDSSRTTEPFSKAVESLPASFPSTSEGSNCTPEAFKRDSQSADCRDPAIVRWMSFFADFGTHVTTNIKLGGKVTKQIRMTKEQAQDLHKKGAGGSASLLRKFIRAGGGVDSKEHNGGNSLEAATTTFAIGGRAPGDPSDPHELAEWARSVAAIPMPVKYELQPLSRLLPEKLLLAYQKAQYFYSRAFGLTLEDLKPSAGSMKPLPELLHTSTAVTWAGSAPGFVDCPRGKKVSFGFAAYMNMNSPTSSFVLKPCQAGGPRCEGPNINGGPEGDTRIWAVCTEEVIESLETFSFADATMSFFFSKAGLANVTMAHCSPGGLECRFQDGGLTSGQTKSQHLIFGACVARGTRGLQDLFATSSAGIVSSSQAVDTSKTALTDCGLSASLVAGFALEVHTLMPLVREAMNVCPEGKRYCGLNTFVVPPSVDGVKRGGAQSREPRYSSLSFAICALKDLSIPDKGPVDSAKSSEMKSENLLAPISAILAEADETLESPANNARSANTDPSYMSHR